MVKVTGSKVKVKYTVMWNNWFAYKTRTEDLILIKLIGMIDIDKKRKLTRSQGHKVKGQGQTCSKEKNFVSSINHEGMIESWLY